MVRPLGMSNARPSSHAYKSYQNHTTAFEGQWRIPRTAPRKLPEVKTYITPNTYMSSTEGIVTKPWWQQLAETLLPIPTLFGSTPEEPVIEQPEVPETPEVEPPDEEPEPAEVTINVDPTAEAELSGETETVTETVTETIEGEEKPTTTEVYNKTTLKKTNADGSKVYEGYTWKSLQDAYSGPNGEAVPNTPAFRNWFRKEYLDGGTDIGVKTQHYPNEITFNGVTYTFNKDNYKPHEYIVNNNGAGFKSGQTKPGSKKTPDQTVTKEVSKEVQTYKGSVKITIPGADGKNTTKIFSYKGKVGETETQVRKNLQDQINNSTLTAQQKTIALGRLNGAVVAVKNN